MAALTMGSRAKDASWFCILIGLGVCFVGTPFAGILLSLISIATSIGSATPGLDYAPVFRPLLFRAPYCFPTVFVMALPFVASSTIASTFVIAALITQISASYVERAGVACATALGWANKERKD